MKESVGLTVTINIVVVFLAVAFVFIIGIVTYNRAYKAASLIVKEIEKYEGYNDLSFPKINEDLTAIGYVGGDSSKCKATRKASGLEGQLVEMGDEKYKYCIYWFDYDESEANKYLELFKNGEYCPYAFLNDVYYVEIIEGNYNNLVSCSIESLISISKKKNIVLKQPVFTGADVCEY